MQATLHLLMGLPGAGKSTLAKVLHDITGAEVLSSDTTRIAIFPAPCFSQEEHDRLYAILDHNLEHLLAAGKDAVYDANLNRLSHRKEKYILANKYEAHVILWWVQTPKQLAKERRVTEQDHTLLPLGETSERMFERIAQILEEPQENENCIVVDGTRITENYIKDLLSEQNAS